MAGRMINGAAALAELIRPASATGEFEAQRVLPVLPELSNLLPSRGLRRGSTIAIGIIPGAAVHQAALPTPTLPVAPTPASPSASVPGSASLSASALTPGSASVSASPFGSLSSATSSPFDGARDLGDPGFGAVQAATSPQAPPATSSASAAHPEILVTDGPQAGHRLPRSRRESPVRGLTSPSDHRDGESRARHDSPRDPSAERLSPAEGGAFAGGASFGGGRSSSVRGALTGGGRGVARGAALTGSGSTSLLLALLAAASSAGSWCAVVGVPTLGALAAAESGIVLDRLALVPDPGPEWPTVVAALIDGVDVVVVAVPGQVSPSITSRLVARARQRGCVLVPYGRWDGADVTLQVTRGYWEGLGAGHGRLRRREVTVVARGRGTASRPKEITMWMPGLSAAPLHDPEPGVRSRPTAVPPPARTADEPGPAPAAGASTSSVPLASVTPIFSAASASPSAAGAAPTASGRLAAGEHPPGTGCA